MSGPFKTPALLRSLTLVHYSFKRFHCFRSFICFDDIDNLPIVRHRKSVVDSSSFIFVDANQEEDATPFPKLPVPAGPGGCIEVKLISSIAADYILGSEIGAGMQAGTKVQLAIFTIVSLWNVRIAVKSFSGTRQSLKRSSNCRTMKPGDTVVEHKLIWGDSLESC
jgi:hypothetical protein